MPRCPVCTHAADDGSTTLPYPAGIGGKGEPDSIVVCPRCGAGFADPMPAAEVLDAFYAGDGYWGERPDITVKRYPLFAALAKARWDSIRRIAGPFPADARMLDIGAGHCFLGMAASRSVGQYTAVEPAAHFHEPVRAAWERGGHRAELKLVKERGEAGGAYDIIALSHVLEHVEEPRVFLNELLEKLKPGGVMFVDVPNRDHRFKSDVFPHLLFFSSSSLSTLLESCGLQVLAADAWGASFDANPLAENCPRWLQLVSSMLNRMKSALPATLSQSLFGLVYGVSRVNDKGMWVRAIARKQQHGD